jgi:hypothetical protein
MTLNTRAANRGSAVEAAKYQNLPSTAASHFTCTLSGKVALSKGLQGAHFCPATARGKNETNPIAKIAETRPNRKILVIMFVPSAELIVHRDYLIAHQVAKGTSFPYRRARMRSLLLKT